MATFDTFLENGMRCHKDNNIELAIQNFTKCIELEPDNYASYNNRELMHYHIDNFGMAIQDFNNSLLLNPNNIDP
jgi:tetratricopeptide (TPR) repeat protein